MYGWCRYDGVFAAGQVYIAHLSLSSALYGKYWWCIWCRPASCGATRQTDGSGPVISPILVPINEGH